MNKEIELLNKKIEAQDKIINTQALEIAKLKEWKEDLLNENIELENIRKEAIEYIKQYNLDGVKLDSEYFYNCLIELLEILGDKENE